MERKTLSQLLSDMKRLWDDYKYTQYQASRELQQGHGGAHQQKMIHCQHLKKKLNFIKHQVLYRVNQPGVRIKFKMGNKNMEAIFPALSKSDGVTYLELLAMVNNCPMEIIEISEIKSEIKET